MIYKDFSIIRQENEDVYCVGWIGSGEGMSTGKVSLSVLDVIFDHCKISVVERYRSTTPCQLCYPDMVSYRKAIFEGEDINNYATHSETQETLCLGSADLIIKKNDKNYYCPDLIWHYIKDHNYLPLDDFLNDLVSK